MWSKIKWSSVGKQVEYVINDFNYMQYENTYMSIWNTNSEKTNFQHHREAIQSKMSGIVVTVRFFLDAPRTI